MSWPSAATYSLKNKQPGRVACTVSLLAVVAAQRGAVPFGAAGDWGAAEGPGQWARRAALVHRTVCVMKHRHGPTLSANNSDEV